MICSKCGQELNEGVKFCTNCGTAVGAGQAGQAQAAQVVKQNTNAPGKKLLFVTGILFAVLTVIGIVTGIIGFSQVTDLFNVLALYGLNTGYAIIPAVLTYLSIASYVVAAIFGIKYCNDTAKAEILRYIALVVFALLAASGISLVMQNNYLLKNFDIEISSATLVGSYVGYVIRLIFPFLFLKGAQKNVSATKMADTF